MSGQFTSAVEAQRRSDLVSASAGSSPAAKAPSSLPAELLERIFALACSTPIVARNNLAGRSDTCTATLLSLSLTSKTLRAFVLPRLFAHIRLARPSALVALQQTLCARPVLGTIIKSLHIGPDKPLAPNWWPLVVSEDGDGESAVKFRLNVDSSDGRCSSSSRLHEINLDSPASGSIDLALRPAVDAACMHLDIDIMAEGHDAAGNDIGTDAWHVRVIEAQAALELYCLHLHALGSTEKPSVCLAVGSKGAISTHDVFVVTRPQIYSRLTRPGAPTDAFDHPLLCARAALPWEATASDGGSHRSYSSPHDFEDPSSFFSWPATSHDHDTVDLDVITPADLAESFDQALPAVVTPAGNIALARCVLSLTPQLKSLSLTGFLEHALLGKRSGPTLHQLRALNTGPPPPGWSVWPRYDPTTLQSLQRLRLCGDIPIIEELEKVTDENSLFVNLREVHWSLPERFADVETEPELLVNIVKDMIGFESDDDVATAMEEQSSDENQQGGDGEDAAMADQNAAHAHAEAPSRVRAPLYIEARLHPQDVALLLNAAPNDSVADAWLEGEAVRGTRHRLKLLEHGERATGGGNSALQVLYDEGRRFWEEG